MVRFGGNVPNAAMNIKPGYITDYLVEPNALIAPDTRSRQASTILKRLIPRLLRTGITMPMGASFPNTSSGGRSDRSSGSVLTATPII